MTDAAPYRETVATARESIAPRVWRRRVFRLGVMLVASASYYDGSRDGNIDLFHEGERLAYFDSFESGAVPFRDLYIQHGLGENVIKSWLAAKLWGPSVESLRRLGSNVYVIRGILPAIAFLAFLAAGAAAIRRDLVFAVFALIALTGLCDVSDRHLFGFIALLAALLQSRRHPRLAAVTAGAAAGLALLYSLDVGVFVIAGFAVAFVLARMPRESLLRLAGGMLAGLALVVGILAGWAVTVGAVRAIGANVYVQLFMRREIFPAGYPSPVWHTQMPLLLNLVNNGQILFFFFGIPAAYGLTLLELRRSKAAAAHMPDYPLTLAACLGLCFWSCVVYRADYVHLGFAMPAFVLFTGILFDRSLGDAARGRLRRLVVGLCVIISAGTMIAAEGGPVVRRLTDRDLWCIPDYLKRSGKVLVRPRLERIGDIGVEPWQAEFLEQSVAHIQKLCGPDDELLDLSDYAVLQFLANRRCATKFHVASHAGLNHKLQQQMVAEMQAQSRLPACVMQIHVDHPPDDPLRRFVQAHYAFDSAVGGLEFLRRRDPPDAPRASPP